MRKFGWNDSKNLTLQKERGISFEEVIYAIETGKLHSAVKHPNPEKYKDQVILYVEVRGYIYAVPSIETAEEIFLKTIFPDRKATKKFLKSR